MKKILNSNVSGFRGLCTPVWLNKNQVCHRLDGGISGFFKMVRKRWFGWQKIGKEFHGIIVFGEVKVTDTKEAIIADDLDRVN